MHASLTQRTDKEKALWNIRVEKIKRKCQTNPPYFPCQNPNNSVTMVLIHKLSNYTNPHSLCKSFVSLTHLQFQFQKPISKKCWWRSALLFFKWKWVHQRHHQGHHGHDDHDDVHQTRPRAFGASVHHPKLSGSTTPYHTTSWSRSPTGPVAWTLTTVTKGEVDTPYLSWVRRLVERETWDLSNWNESEGFSKLNITNIITYKDEQSVYRLIFKY